MNAASLLTTIGRVLLKIVIATALLIAVMVYTVLAIGATITGAALQKH